MLSIKLALRGLWKHRLRTLSTLAAVAAGYLFLQVFMAMHEGGHGEMIEIGIRQGHAGHVVIQAEGYQQSRAVARLVPEPEAVMRTVREALPGARVVPRVFGGGLLRSVEGSTGVFFAGVDPQEERPVSPLARGIVQGVYLRPSSDEVKAAESTADALWCTRPPAPGAPAVQGAVLGAELARTLRVSLCGKVVLMAQGLGEQEAVQLRVVGLARTGSADLDAAYVHVKLAVAQRLLFLGDAVHQLAVFVDSADRSSEAHSRIRKALAAQPNGEAPLSLLALLRWDQALPELAEFIWLDANSGWVFMIIIFVIIAVGVLNTILMSVMERTREFGVMRALGMRPPQVARIVLWEGLLIGCLGVLLGLAAALPILDYLATTGIDLTPGDAGTMEMGGMSLEVIRGKWSAGQLLRGALAVFGVTCLSAIYPAVRAARLRLLGALTHV